MSEGHCDGAVMRIPANQRVKKPQYPSPSLPSPSPLTGRRRRNRRNTYTPLPTRSSRPAAKILVLKRCNSEPALLLRGSGDHNDDDRRSTTMKPRLHAAEEILFRPKTCEDLFVSPDYSHPRLSPHKCFKSFNKDAKVVVTVTIEGSPGPIRTMVRLGCSVEDTIKHVVKIYNEERRTPQLDKDVNTCMFELHHSNFSLQGLNKSKLIGEIGSRSFYLRKSSSCSSSSRDDECVDTSPDIVFISKIITRTRGLWKFLGCLQCGE